jgi:hypothetical protein
MINQPGIWMHVQANAVIHGSGKVEGVEIQL